MRRRRGLSDFDIGCRRLRRPRCRSTRRPHESRVIKTLDAGGRAGRGGSGVVIVHDTGDELPDSERRVREAARFNAVAGAAAHLGTWHLDVGRNRLDYSDELLALLGLTRGEWDGTPEGLEAIVHADDVERRRRDRAVALERGELLEHDFRIVWPNGEIRWMYSRGNLIRDAAGRTIEAYGVMMDVTERKRAEEALRESERRFRATFENAAVGIAHVAPDGSLLRANDRFCRIVGCSPDDLTKNTLAGISHPDDLEANLVLFKRVLAGEIDQYEMDKRYLRKDGTVVWGRLTVGCVRKEDGTVDYFISVVEDITERKRREEQVDLLMREVNHRAKNLLAVVLAIARRARPESSPELFTSKLERRITALAASHDLLVRSAWQGIDVRDLVCSQLAHFKDLIGERIILDGPSIRLRPAAAQAIGLVLHELSTNATKYGALSQAHGSVQIEWGLLADQCRFKITWTESGGPAPVKFTALGFGHTVLVDMVKHALDADVELSLRRSGLVWNMVAPAQRSVDAGQWIDRPT